MGPGGVLGAFVWCAVILVCLQPLFFHKDRIQLRYGGVTRQRVSHVINRPAVALRQHTSRSRGTRVRCSTAEADVWNNMENDGEWGEGDESEMAKLLGEDWMAKLKQAEMIEAQKKQDPQKPPTNPHIEEAYGVLGLGFTPLVPDSYAVVANSTLSRVEGYYKEILALCKDPSKSAITITRLLDEVLASLHTTLDALGVVNQLASDAESAEDIAWSLHALSNFEHTLRLDPTIAKAVEVELKSSSALSEEEKLMARRWVRDFSRSSYAMPEKKQKKARELLPQMFQLTEEYSDNIANNNRTIAMQSDIAMFLPLQHQAILRQYLGLDENAPLPRGQNLTLPANNFFAGGFLRTVPYSKLREEMYQKYESIDANTAILDKLLATRQKLAKVYGFNSYADLATDGSLFENSNKVTDFLTDISQKVLPMAKTQTKILANLKRQTEGGESLHDWDVEYYLSKAAGMMSNVDGDKVAEYFPVDVVVDGMRFVGERLFGIKFFDATLQAFDKGDLWDVTVVKLMVNDRNNQTLGYVYLDLFDRPGKMQGSMTLRARAAYNRPTQASKERKVAKAVLSTSIPPNPNENERTLLSHEQVRALFHEFGHCLHEVLSNTESYSQSGCNGQHAQTDFVEIPAVLMEKFAWDPRVLGTFATHYRTGQPPPDQMLIDLASTRKAFAAMRAQEKIAFSMLDQLYHRDWEGTKVAAVEDGDSKPAKTSAVMRQVFADHFPVKTESNPYGGSWETKWSHLSDTAYAGNYFTYVVAEVVSASIWDKLFAADPLNEQSGKKYWDAVFSPGSPEKPQEGLIQLVGENYLDPDAWVKSLS